MTLFDYLPNEIIQHIFSFDDLQPSQINLVSKRFRNNMRQIKVVRLKSTETLYIFDNFSIVSKLVLDLSLTTLTCLILLRNRLETNLICDDCKSSKDKMCCKISLGKESNKVMNYILKKNKTIFVFKKTLQSFNISKVYEHHLTLTHLSLQYNPNKVY